MSDLMTGTSGYQTGSIDTATSQTNNVSPHNANHINGVAQGVIQVETILGNGPTLKGSVADLVARLVVALSPTGTLNSGLAISSPTITSPTITSATITAPAISSPVISGTISGTYTIGGTPTIPASAGASMVFIESLDVSSDNIFNTLGSTYDVHVFELIGIIPGTSTANLLLTVSSDNGVTFANSAYSYSIFGVLTTAAASIVLATSLSSVAANNGVNGFVYLFRPQATAVEKHLTFSLSFNGTVAGFQDVHGAGSCADTTPNVVANAIDAIRFAMSGGTIAGTIRHYGIKNS